MIILNMPKKVALSMFEWVNLPESMDARYVRNAAYIMVVAPHFLKSKLVFISILGLALPVN